MKAAGRGRSGGTSLRVEPLKAAAAVVQTWLQRGLPMLLPTAGSWRRDPGMGGPRRSPASRRSTCYSPDDALHSGGPAMGRREAEGDLWSRRMHVAKNGAVMVEASDGSRRPERTTMEARRDLVSRTPLVISTTPTSFFSHHLCSLPSLSRGEQHGTVPAFERSEMVAQLTCCVDGTATPTDRRMMNVVRGRAGMHLARDGLGKRRA